tara:strand:+ start:1271 stop:1615 length:345 start_codon:yes stop_codon:yes gene_type:complete
MPLKRLIIITAALALSVSPAWAEPVDLECEGTLSWMGESGGSGPISGIHIVVRGEQVEVSGLSIYSASYSVDRSKGEEALIFLITAFGAAISTATTASCLCTNTTNLTAGPMIK